MGQLQITSSGLDGEFEVGETPGKVGRSRDNAIRLAHKSVSRHHAVFTESEGKLLVKDLASSYGSFINEDRITEGVAEDGDVIRLGRIRLTYSSGIEGVPAADPISSEPAKEEKDEMAPDLVQHSGKSPAASVEERPCDRHPKNSLSLICPKCHLKFCEECVNKIAIGGKEKSFCPYCKEVCKPLAFHLAEINRQKARESRTLFQALPDILKFPLGADGLLLLMIGTIVYMVLDFAAQFSIPVAIIASGYLFAYVQKIVISTANGDESLPPWPDFSEWWLDLLRPCLMFVLALVVSFLPAILYLLWSISGGQEMSLSGLFPMIAWGMIYLPMCILAIGMTDDFTAASPLVVIPSISRLYIQYFFATFMLFSMVACRFVAENLFTAYISVPYVPTLLTAIVSLYFLTVEMRLLGVMFFVNKRNLSWYRN